MRPTWGYFSAVCLTHGVTILEATNRPQGLLESCWGGTRIQTWSSTEAAAACAATSATLNPGGEVWAYPDELATAQVLYPAADGGGGGDDDGNHYAAMINPLLSMPIKSAIWYQGEANSAAESANLYFCQLKALIVDWRSKWHRTNNFTFGVAQLVRSYQTTKRTTPAAVST